MSKINNSRVQSNLLQQNCFVRDVTRIGGLVNSCAPETFMSLDEVVTSKGVDLKESLNDYPITPQYVKSFADSVDYHSNLSDALSNPSRGVNLGDVSDVQRVAGMDTEQARALYAELSKVFSVSSDQSVRDAGSSPEVRKDV